MPRYCTVKGCKSVQLARGYCSRHYWRWKRGATNLEEKSQREKTVEERFWEKVPYPRAKTKCWNWQGFCTKKGYGYFRVGSFVFKAHRFSYELHFDLIDEGMTVDHLCGNTSCVNPRHMEVVTIAENTRRARARWGDKWLKKNRAEA